MNCSEYSFIWFAFSRMEKPGMSITYPDSFLNTTLVVDARARLLVAVSPSCFTNLPIQRYDEDIIHSQHDPGG